MQLFGEPSCETVWPVMCRLKSIWAECVLSEVTKKKKGVFAPFSFRDLDYSAKRPKHHEGYIFMASVTFSIMQKNGDGQYLGLLAFQAHSKDEDGTGSVS